MSELNLPKPEDVSAVISNEVNSDNEVNFAEGKLKTDESSNINRYKSEIDYVIRQQFANSLEQNRRERIKYAKWTFWLTVSWIVIVLTLVFLSGITYHCEKVLQMSDTVLITLITTTTVNVFAFFILVMQFLFNKEELAALSFLFDPSKNGLNGNSQSPSK